MQSSTATSLTCAGQSLSLCLLVCVSVRWWVGGVQRHAPHYVAEHSAARSALRLLRLLQLLRALLLLTLQVAAARRGHQLLLATPQHALTLARALRELHRHRRRLHSANWQFHRSLKLTNKQDLHIKYVNLLISIRRVEKKLGNCILS